MRANVNSNPCTPNEPLRRTPLVVVLALLGLAGLPRLAAAENELADAEARALYRAGTVAFEEGRFADALGHFQRSYELSGRSELLYNVASAADRARQDQVALDAYERFLATSTPEPRLRARVENRIRELRTALAEAEAREAARRAADERARADAERASAAPTATEPAPVADVDDEPRSSKPLALSLVGGGAAVAAAGAVVLALGARDRSKVEGPEPGTPWTPSHDRAYDHAPRRLTSGAILVPVGVLGAVGGAITLVSTARGSDADRAAALRVGPGSLVLEGRF